jgi:cytoskeletal protein RodZ
LEIATVAFKKKKIETETLGEFLASARENLSLSVEEAAQKAAMKRQFLASLEDGDFSKLPPDVYVVGFLKQLAVMYSVDSETLINQYKKEHGIVKHIAKAEIQGPRFKHFIEKLVITPKLLSILLGTGFVVITILYVVWQVLSINKNPSLEIFEPKDRQVIGQSSVTVSGKTDPGMTVTINDQVVFVDSDGNFKTQLGISPGPKDLVFVAKNKFDKQVKRIISVVGEAQAALALEPLIVMELKAGERIEVDFSLDGGENFHEIIEAGNSKQIRAMGKIVLSTSNAGETRVIFNNQDLGVLGRKGEKLVDVPFTLK